MIVKMQKKTKLYLLLAAVNLLLAGAIAGVFFRYIDQNQKLVYMGSVQGVQDASAEVTRQLYRYMRKQQDAVSNIAYYITETGLNEEETLVYLEHLKNFNGTIAVVSCDTCQGYAIDTDTDGMRKQTDFSSNAVISQLCDSFLQGQAGAQELMVTDVFSDTDKRIAFYQTIRFGEEKQVLLYIMELQKIVEESLGDSPIARNQGILIDSSGNILSGLLAAAPMGTGAMNENFFSILERQGRNEDISGIRERIATEENGNFTITDHNGQEWLYIFTKLEGIDGWIYIYTEQHVAALMSSKDLNSLLQVVILMGLFGGVNIAVIVWQNGRLKKNLRVIEEKNKELEVANQAKNSFISNMSHEIRTPINAVLGMDEMILRESSEEQIREYAVNIKSAGRTLLGIINDILDFSKIESGKMEIINAEYEIASVVNDLLTMTEAKAKEKKLKLCLHINENIPHLLYGDELRIKQIILNILTNAVKYTEKGSITFSMDYEKKDEETILLKVSVKDTGIGIRPEEKEKLFAPFERIDEKRNRTIEGTGLGMSIVMRLLKQMESKLVVDSVYGEGSEFSFLLEQKVIDWEKAGNLEKLHETAIGENAATEVLFEAPEAKILVVDDTPMNLTVVRGLLKRTKLQVDTAQSGMECIAMLKKQGYDVLFLDHRMPEMDGIETLHKIRETSEIDQSMPIIALTANVVSGAAAYYLKEGFCDFLSKPVSAGKLERMLLKYLPKELIKKPGTEPETRQPEKENQTAEQTGQRDVVPEQEAIFRKLSEQIPEFSPEAGRKACGSDEVLKEVLREFAETADTRIKEITEYYETGDLKNYTVKVHALKSSARLVGAEKLSEEAAYLEKCGEEENVQEILLKTSELLDNYRSFTAKLKEIFTDRANEECPEISEAELKEALFTMRTFNEAFDFDNIDAIMSTLMKYRMPKQAEEMFQALRQAVLDVNQEKIAELIQNYVGGNESE